MRRMRISGLTALALAACGGGDDTGPAGYQNGAGPSHTATGGTATGDFPSEPSTGGTAPSPGGTGGGAPAGTGGSGTNGSGGPPSGCGDVSGTWAGLVDIPASWGPRNFVQPGEGIFFQTLLADISSDGSSSTASVRTCSLSVPPFQAGSPPLVLNTLQPFYPVGMFDAGGIPAFSFTSQLDGEGTRFTTSQAALVMGLDLGDPVGAPFPPSPSAGLAVAADHDADGNPGVTVVPTPGTQGFIVDGSGFGAEAQQMFLGVRTTFSMSGQIDSCEGMSGQLSISAMEIRVLGCDIAGNGASPCNPMQTEFLDDNSPLYQVSSGGFVMVKVDGGTTCAQVRDRFQIQ